MDDKIRLFELKKGDIFNLGCTDVYYKVCEQREDGSLIIECIEKPPTNQWIVESDGLEASMILDFDELMKG